MLRNFFLVSFRRMWRSKGSTVVHVVGLTLGLASAIAIAAILRFELSFDDFYPNGDRLYKIVTDEVRDGVGSSTSASPGGMADALIQDIAGVEEATLIYVDYGGLFTVRDGSQEKKFDIQNGVARVTPAFFGLFGIPVLEGTPEALEQPNTVVLTKRMAERFFGSTPPMGHTIRMDNLRDLTVVGIIPDRPANTHVSYTILTSSADIHEKEAWLFDWRNLTTNAQTYVLLRSGVDPADIESQFTVLREKHMREVVNPRVFHLQRITDTHFDPRYADGIGRTVSLSSLWGLGIIGLFLIVTACVNFVNMATAQAVTRSREVGVRKVLGVAPAAIMMQFLGETLLIVALSASVSILLVDTLLPVLATTLDIPVSLDLTDPVMLGLIVSLLCGVTLLSGLYPARVLGGFRPVLALKGNVSTSGRNLRRVLVVLQFVISQMLIAGTLIVLFQMDYLKDADLGLDPEGVVVIPVPEPNASTLRTMKTELLREPQIQSASFSWNSAISGNVWDTNIRYRRDGKEELLNTDLKYADEEYLATYGLTLAAGRMYLPSDTVREFVVNESFVRAIGIQDPAEAVGILVQLGRTSPPYPIVGVVRDFNTQSLRETIRPCLLTTRTNRYYEAGLRIRTDNITATMGSIERVWTATFPHHVFSYQFLDDRITEFYEQEQRMALLFRLFASIAILLGCIGLVGLVSYMAERKTKEIGVRKVLGATTTSILMQFSGEFGALIAMAFVIATPVTYLVMNDWLRNFAFRISIGPGVFVVTIAVSVLIAAMTVSIRAFRAASANPVKNLRYE